MIYDKALEMMPIFCLRIIYGIFIINTYVT